MLPITIIACWMLLVALVLGLCAGARRGDIAPAALQDPTSPVPGEWEPVTAIPITSHPDRVAAPPRTAVHRRRRAEEPARIARVGGAVG